MSSASNAIGQKAPSAKRCIKTHAATQHQNSQHSQSESTERQKVH